ncbi:hypothetical protein Hanom_Chr02g00117581 [Helianthus anomalus]
MDAGFGRIDCRQDRQDGAIRYMMERMSMRVPDFFQPYVDPTQLPMSGYYDPTGSGGSSGMHAGQGSGYVQPEPVFQVYDQGDEDSDEEMEEEEEDESNDED